MKKNGNGVSTLNTRMKQIGDPRIRKICIVCYTNHSISTPCGAIIHVFETVPIHI